MKWIHNLLKCFSFSAVLFTFEACYGCMEDEYYDLAINVVDSEGVAIPNVEVRVTPLRLYNVVYTDTTDNAGLAFINGRLADSYDAKDKDGYDVEVYFKPLKGVDFQAKDTCFKYSLNNNNITVTLDRK